MYRPGALELAEEVLVLLVMDPQQIMLLFMYRPGALELAEEFLVLLLPSLDVLVDEGLGFSV